MIKSHYGVPVIRVVALIERTIFQFSPFRGNRNTNKVYRASMDDGTSTSTEAELEMDNNSSTPVHTHHKSTVYYVMASSEYCGVSLGVIIFLIILVGILCCLYYRLRRKEGERYIKTVRYTPVSQRESEDERSHFKKRPLSHGLAYDAPPRYTPSALATQATVPVSPHMDISAGHLLLTYIEDNLKNRNKLKQEWEVCTN